MWLDRGEPAEMSDNGGSAVGLLSYETLVHAVAGAMVSSFVSYLFVFYGCWGIILLIADSMVLKKPL